MPNLVLNAAKLWRNAMDVIGFNVPNVPMNAVGCVYKDGASILCAIDSLKLETKISDFYTFIYVSKIIPIVEQWKTKSSKMKLIGKIIFLESFDVKFPPFWAFLDENPLFLDCLEFCHIGRTRSGLTSTYII